MQFLIVWMIFLSLLITLVPFAHTEAIKLVDEVKKSEVPASEHETARVVGSLVQQGFEGMVQEAGIQNPIRVVRKTAEEAARSVGRSLAQYIRGQYQHKKNEDLLQNFDEALYQNFVGLQMNQEERRRMVLKIEDAYIRDAESGAYELDQQNFRDLPVMVKKEYAEIELARTQKGNVPTYDSKGILKTLWGVENGVLHGPSVTYYQNGEIKFIDFYENGRKVNRKKYDKEGKLVFEQNYDYQKPEIPQAEKTQISVIAVTEKKTSEIIPASQPTETAPGVSSTGTQQTQPQFKALQPIATAQN